MMNIDELYGIYQQNPTVVTDSRVACAKSMFFALKGERFDGNDFAAQALAAGCSYAVVDRLDVATDGRYILVDNVLVALQDLALKHRQKLNIPVVAITGTNGKTTTRELLTCILAKKYKVAATAGNLNNHIGVPLTILSIPTDARIAVIEMGASHAGEIKTLCEIARPDCGLVTNIGKAHLQGFENVDGVKKAKGELYDYLSKNHGTIFYNANNPVLAGMLEHTIAKTVHYGLNGQSECWAEVAPHASPFLNMVLYIKGRRYKLTTQMAGTYNVENFVAAIAIGRRYGVSPRLMLEALTAYTPQNKRSQIIETAHNRILADSYNANPDSMLQALNSFYEQTTGTRMVILGDMLELGKHAPHEHAAIAGRLQQKDTTHILVGQHFYEAAKGASGILAFQTVDEVRDWLVANPPSDTLILLKGSRSMKMEQLIQFIP